MRFSEQWLRSWIDIPLDIRGLVNQFTMAGLEVDSFNFVGAEFTEVVVGKILLVDDHPNAKRLHCCQVDIGGVEPLMIVCGADNVRPGLKVAVATVGARLPKNIQIAATELRGILSYGMICSATELNLVEQSQTASHAHAPTKGIMELPEDAPIGTLLKDYLKLQDHIIDIEVTPNRADCLSIRGLAREVAVINQLPFQDKEIIPVPFVFSDPFKIEVKAPQICPRYCGRVIRNINAQAKTPLWIQEALRRSNIRSINPIVDVTNFVMLELGQPMHAFDLDKLQGSVCIRMANSGEKLLLLDGREVTLDTQTLVIADQQFPHAIAGVMGGDIASVSTETKHVFLESAYFDPIQVGLTARRYGIQTDSSYRFARGVDFNLQVNAIERATALLQEIVDGETGVVTEVMSESHLPQRLEIMLQPSHVQKLLGIHVEPVRIEQILTSLGMKLYPVSEGWQVHVPSYRFDISVEADLIEEIARIYGYQHIPAKPLQSSLVIPHHSETQLSTERLSKCLIDRGYHEIISYSFVDPIDQQWLDPLHQAIPLDNPISQELSVMRTNLWPGLVKVANYNFNRQINLLRLFEIGHCFWQEGEHWQQVARLGGLIGGQAYPQQWGMNSRQVDFYDIKGDVESLLTLTNRPHAYTWQVSEHPSLHPGQQALLLDEGKIIGYVGAIHPNVLQKIDLTIPVFVFELDLQALQTAVIPQFKCISKFPAIRRDIALIISRELPVQHIKQFIQELIGNKLVDIIIFDIYQGDQLASSEKSVALGLTFQEISRTLTDIEINDIVANILQQLKLKFNAKLRI